MNGWMRAAIAFSSAGTLSAILCLIKTTPLIMTFFFFFGLPCFGAGIAIYLLLALRVLKLVFRLRR